MAEGPFDSSSRVELASLARLATPRSGRAGQDLAQAPRSRGGAVDPGRSTGRKGLLRDRPVGIVDPDVHVPSSLFGVRHDMPPDRPEEDKARRLWMTMGSSDGHPSSVAALCAIAFACSSVMPIPPSPRPWPPRAPLLTDAPHIFQSRHPFTSFTPLGSRINFVPGREEGELTDFSFLIRAEISLPAHPSRRRTGPLAGATIKFGEPYTHSDAWGNLIRYRCPGPVHKRGWDLWSVGPNGVDEQGQGDDILVGEDVASLSTGS